MELDVTANLLISTTQIKTEELIFGGIFTLVFIALTYYISDRAKKGKVPSVRRLPALDGIDYVIEKAAELGKPIYYEITGTPARAAPMIVAGLSILSHVARRCANVGCRLIFGYTAPEISPQARSVLEAAAKEEGKEGYFKSEDFRYLSTDAFSSAAIGLQTVETEDCRAAIAMGAVSINAMPLAMANKARGCVAIEGTAYMSQIYAVGLITDYNLIGEELYAAGAMLSKDVDTLATLRTQDIIKLFIIVLILAMAIAVPLEIL